MSTGQNNKPQYCETIKNLQTLKTPNNNNNGIAEGQEKPVEMQEIHFLQRQARVNR